MELVQPESKFLNFTVAPTRTGTAVLLCAQNDMFVLLPLATIFTVQLTTSLS